MTAAQIEIFLKVLALGAFLWGVFKYLQSIKDSCKTYTDKQIAKNDEDEEKQRELRKENYDIQFKAHKENVDKFISKLVVLDNNITGQEGIYNRVTKLEAEMKAESSLIKDNKNRISELQQEINKLRE